MARKRSGKSNLVKKVNKLKREATRTTRSAAGFVPGLGTALVVSDTARGMGKTAKAAKEYVNELLKNVKR